MKENVHRVRETKKREREGLETKIKDREREGVIT